MDKPASAKRHRTTGTSRKEGISLIGAKSVENRNLIARYLSAEFWTAHKKRRQWIIDIHKSEPVVRMELVRSGVPAQAVQALAEVFGVSREHLLQELGIPRATVERKLKSGDRLGVAASECVIGVTRLIGQVEQIVRESGDPAAFDAGQWVRQWLETPLAALGGRPPMKFMDTAEGREVVSGLVARMQSGAYA